MKMKIVELVSDDITECGNGRLTLTLRRNEGAKVKCLGKDYEEKKMTFEKRGLGLDGGGYADVPIFWLEPHREHEADMYWSKLDNSSKFKVSDGAYKDFVGYLRSLPSASDKEMH